MTHEKMNRKITQLISQWDKLHPDHELVVISLPKKDPKQRKLLLTQIMGFLPREHFE